MKGHEGGDGAEDGARPAVAAPALHGPSLEGPALDAPFTRLGDIGARLGESPVWAPKAGAVWWVDIESNRLHRTRLHGAAASGSTSFGATISWTTPEPPGFVQLDADETPILGMQSGLFRFDPEAAAFDRIAPQPIASQRFNDSCLDSHGGLWAGTMDLGNARADGVLYRITPDGALTPVLDGFRTINGLAWDAAADRLYVSDSHPDVQAVWILDCPGGAPRPETRRLFADFRGLDGRPDGAAIDAASGYWIAGVDGGALYRFAPDGRLTARLGVPVAFPTKPAFVGAGLGRMALTSKGVRGDDGTLRVWAGAGQAGWAGAPAPLWPCGRDSAWTGGAGNRGAGNRGAGNSGARNPGVREEDARKEQQ